MNIKQNSGKLKMTGRGKGVKGIGKGDAKRHRKILRDQQAAKRHRKVLRDQCFANHPRGASRLRSRTQSGTRNKRPSLTLTDYE